MLTHDKDCIEKTKSPGNLCLITLTFRVINRITQLPHYHGYQWSGLFKTLLRALGKNQTSGFLHVHPTDTGIMEYYGGEIVNVGLTFPGEAAASIGTMLMMMKDTRACISYSGESHFVLGKTIEYHHATCRISGMLFNPETPVVLNQGHLVPEIDILMKLDSFSIIFESPLRLLRPEGEKIIGHEYCDEAYFLPQNNTKRNLSHFCRRLDTTFPAGDELYVEKGALHWIETKSCREQDVKALSGVMGILHIRGNPSPEAAKMLIMGQYSGLGKCRNLGRGVYRIPQLDGVRIPIMVPRGTSLLSRIASKTILHAALERIKNAAPGQDGISAADLLKAGDSLIDMLSHNITEGVYKPSTALKHKQHKPGGSVREITIPSLVDRIVQRACADVVSPVIDPLLSDSAYAYRRNMNAKGAANALRTALAGDWKAGIQADIASFFDSIERDTLEDMLEGLFPREPLIRRLMSWFDDMTGDARTGIPQGSPLSPLLSNLYLAPFYRDMERADVNLIGYADDFIMFSPNTHNETEIMRCASESLRAIGLSLKPEKTVVIKQNSVIKFLGYLVTASDVTPAPKEVSGNDNFWSLVFHDTWKDGVPVYITLHSAGARSSRAHLIVKKTQETEDKIPWEGISRIIIVGRALFSGSVIYGAVRKGIPVTFVDVMGRCHARMHPEQPYTRDHYAAQMRHATDPAFCLEIAKNLITAKINNSRILLRRNRINCTELKDLETEARSSKNLDSLRGYEGITSKIYFGHFGKLVEPFEFRERVYHPPDCPVNVMLSFAYTLLYNRIAITLHDMGFATRVGFMHCAHGRHATLASDLMEPLRHIADRTVLSLIHKNEIRPEHFSVINRGDVSICRMCGDGFVSLINRFENNMASETNIAGVGRISYNSYLDEAVGALRRTLYLGIPYKPLRID